MSNDCSNAVCWLMLMVLLVGPGCKRAYEAKEEEVVYNPLADPNFVMSDSLALQAIEASGGRQAWIGTKKLEFDAVVTFYHPDGSFYLTEQHHEIAPWMNSIRMSAKEPQGDLVWALSRGRFSVSQHGKPASGSAVGIVNRSFAEAILSIMTAPKLFVDGSISLVKGASPVRIQGQWYYPIRGALMRGGGAASEQSEWVLYQSRDSSLVEMIWFTNIDEDSNGGGLAVRGYEYRRIEKGGVLVPAKIETYRTGAGGTLKERLAKIDYCSLN